MTAFTRDRRRDWLSLLPLLRLMDRAHQAASPKAYAVQAHAAAATHPYYRIPGTVSTTLTANRNWQSPVHKDEGNLPGTMSALAVLEAGRYAGGHLAFPKWGVGIDVREGDVLVADFAAEFHGNTPVEGAEGGYTRVSVVLYFRAGLRQALSPEQASRQARHRNAHLRAVGGMERVLASGQVIE
jgi:hypothetical protein